MIKNERKERKNAHVNVVGKVVPLARRERCAPLRLPTEMPLKIGWVRGNAVLEL